MKDDKKVPQLRFPEFTDAWKQRKVGDLLVERREMVTEDNEYPLMAFIANEGVAPKGDRFDRSALVKNADSKKYKRTKYGDFIYSSNNLESGSIGLNKYGKASISPVYSIFYPTNLADSDFIGRYFLRKDFIGQMIRWRQGVVYGQWKIPEADFLNIDIYIPSKDEQEKIGQILDKVDNTITLQQRKLNSLQKLKKGLLQKMFPKNGENIPEIRFPEFSDAWKQRKLCEFVNFYSGLTYKPEDVNQIGTFVLRSSNVKNGEILDADNVYVNEDIAKSEKVQLGDIIVVVRNGSRDLIGKHATVKRSMPNTVIGAFMTGIRAKEYSFVNALLDTNQFEKEINKNLGATINQITGYMFSNMSFTIPSEEEQHKIGSFFTQLDNTITLQQRKLEFLQKLKKGLLQQMFI